MRQAKWSFVGCRTSGGRFRPSRLAALLWYALLLYSKLNLVGARRMRQPPLVALSPNQILQGGVAGVGAVPAPMPVAPETQQALPAELANPPAAPQSPAELANQPALPGELANLPAPPQSAADQPMVAFSPADGQAAAAAAAAVPPNELSPAAVPPAAAAVNAADQPLPPGLPPPAEAAAKDSDSVVGFAPPLGIAMRTSNNSQSVHESGSDEFKKKTGGMSIGMLAAIVAVAFACLVGVIVACASLRKNSHKGSTKSKDTTRKDDHDPKRTMKKLIKEKKKNDQKKYIKAVVHKAVKSRDKHKKHHNSSTGRSGKSSSRKSDSEVSALIRKK